MPVTVIIRERRAGQPSSEIARWNMPEAPLKGDALVYGGTTYTVVSRMWIHPLMCSIVVEFSS